MDSKESSLLIAVNSGKGDHNINISDNTGNSDRFKGALVVAADNFANKFYVSGSGDPREAAHALVEGLAHGIQNDALIGENWYEIFYMTLLAEMAMRTGARPHQNEVTAEELLKRIEGEPGKKSPTEH